LGMWEWLLYIRAVPARASARCECGKCEVFCACEGEVRCEKNWVCECECDVRIFSSAGTVLVPIIVQFITEINIHNYAQ
jgi:hypothetical protein